MRLYVSALLLACSSLLYSKGNDSISATCLKAEEQLRIAQLINKSSNPAQAFDQLRGCSASNEAFSLKKAKYLFDLGKYTDCKRELLGVVKSPTLSDFQLGTAYHYLGKVNYEEEKYTDAILYFNKSSSAGYKKYENVFQSARSYNMLNNYTTSISLYKYYLKKYPRSSAAINNIGACYENQDKNEIAYYYYCKADSMANHNNPLYLSNRIYALNYLKRYKEALKEAQVSYPKFPQHTRLACATSYALAENGYARQSLDIIQRLPKHVQSENIPAFRLAYGYSDLAMFDSSFYYYAVAIAAKPTDWHSYGNMSRNLATLGKFELAKTYADKALELNPEFEDGYGYLHDVYYKSGRYEEALKVLEVISEKFPNNDKTLNRIGYANLELGNYEKSIPYFAKDTVARPKDTKPYNNMGRAFAKLGQPEKAFELFDKAIKRDSLNSFIYHNRAALYADLGNYDLMCKDIKKSLQLEYNYKIDSIIIEKVAEHCPEISLDRKIHFYGFKGNIDELKNKPMITVLNAKTDQELEALLDSTIALNSKLESITPIKTVDYLIYPNPSSGKFKVSFRNDEVTLIKIFDLNGVLKTEFSVNKTQEKLIDVTHLSKGNYIVMLLGNQDIFHTAQIIIQK
jgi:tetratricopeptide (TPR) repeat protein